MSHVRSIPADALQETDPTVELGNQAAGVVPWSSFYDTAEDVSELAWPQSVFAYNKMRNDEQIAALLLSFMLPIFGYRWYVDPNGARDEVVQHVASDFGLPIEGQDPEPPGRRRDRFSFGDYLYHAMLKLPYGFMFFEQVYRVGADGKLHIRKLAPRMPGSISQIQTAPDGGLVYIRQYASGYNFDPMVPYGSQIDVSLFGALRSPLIPVNRLIAHVNEKEGGNWFGRPWLRALYRSWLLKDRLLRVDAMKHERNGMGVPTIEAPPNASQGQMTTLGLLAQMYKSGEASGGALPNGAKLTLNGVTGSLPDTLASIRYHDEQMSRRFLAMFTQLGSTQTGSRALGNTFVDFFGLAQQAVAKTFVDVTNEHAIEDLVDLNYGIDESAPLVRFRPESDRALATADLVALINAQAITVDSELEDYIRAEYDLPEREQNAGQDATATVDSQGASGDPAAASNRLPLRVNAGSRPRNDSKKKRAPTTVEEQSKVDFKALKTAFDEQLSQLVRDWNDQVKSRQIEELSAAIASIASNDVESLASIQATPVGSDLLTGVMQAFAAEAADRAVDEIKAQGVDLEKPDMTEVNDLLSRRANATDSVMANSISQAAREFALREAGGSIPSADIAVDVADHLNGLKDTYLNDHLGGSLMQAQNSARREVFDAVPNKKIYASELKDYPGCCDPCETIDGTPYNTMAEAEQDYPLGGYKDCEGGLRCRGTLVCVAETETEPSVQ